MELGKSIGQLSRALVVSTVKDIARITTFNRALAWFRTADCEKFSISDTQVLNSLQTLLKSLLTCLDQVYVVQERNVMNVRLVISMI